MLREVLHFVRHAPATLRLKQRSASQADLYDTLMERADAAGLGRERDALVHGLSGEVLEIGAGTGRMFPRYGAGVRLTALEPDADFAARAAAPAAAARADVRLVAGAAESLPFAAASFDAVVVCLVLCSVASVPAVLAEIARVLRPGGELRLLEHVRSERALPGLLMRVWNGPWRLLNAQGCNMHRDPLPALAQAGFEVIELTRFQVFSPGLPAFPMRRLRLRHPHMP